jgi:hypothetical protein
MLFEHSLTGPLGCPSHGDLRGVVWRPFAVHRLYSARDLALAGVAPALLLVAIASRSARVAFGQQQQLATARIRAIEHNRSMLVSYTTGVSPVIAPDGSLLARVRHLAAALTGRARPTAHRPHTRQPSPLAPTPGSEEH